ncbi:uncharacterized protein J3D65DRAFT_445026 [Phyllosticta citribraziliensis]|uniref:Cysteine-rich protein n=1 Tax=Phyllosticta citribraziliensis TaxID=989973 RepID=A0ABR1LKQ4_9PEZI
MTPRALLISEKGGLWRRQALVYCVKLSACFGSEFWHFLYAVLSSWRLQHYICRKFRVIIFRLQAPYGLSNKSPKPRQARPLSEKITTSSASETIPSPDKPTTNMRLNKSTSLTSAALLLSLPSLTTAGPAAYGLCQAGCAGIVVACYGAAGFTFGTVLAAAAPPAIAACNTAYGSCQAACAGVLLAPTP